MKSKLILALTLSVLAANTFAADGYDRTGSATFAADGYDRTGSATFAA
ncbi:heme utilization protein, partial [Pseudomonas protegens]